ncbi:putative 2-acylglycerol O-acyltransferase [Rosa chinensis]|uniref:Putative 2-acylglycerol O-acyltransferase n=1 Tax=Rosa chinensis TaxID=74649 RepID=A0A2P6SJG9_ROSCH|nr:putative 2-acylglycerol O-acyltransferase [Rosa chinensis]
MLVAVLTIQPNNPKTNPISNSLLSSTPNLLPLTLFTLVVSLPPFSPAQKMPHPISEANEQSPFGALTAEEFYSRHSVSHGSDYLTNPRGLKLFTQWWTPLPPAEVLGVLAVVHGFTGETSWFVQLTAVHFAKAGFAVCAIDHQGHGFSDGLVAHIPDVNPVVDDCISFFESFRARHAPSLPSFLYAESLGGAIAILLALSSPRRPLAKPRAATALELLRVCKEVQGKFEEVEVPLLIVHGGEDVVCDPACVEELYKRASSKDKTLRIHPGMWHQLIGETPENVELVFGEMVDWLRTRAARAADNGGA